MSKPEEKTAALETVEKLLTTMIARSVHHAVFCVTNDADQANEIAKAITSLSPGDMAQAGQLLGGYLQVKIIEKAASDYLEAQRSPLDGLYGIGGKLKQ